METSVSTTKPSFEMDCEEFAAAKVSFKLMDITTGEHRQFVLEFATKHRWAVAHADGTAFLYPSPKDAEQDNWP